MLLPEDGELCFAHLADILVENRNAASRGLFKAGKLVEQRRFSGTGSAEDTADLPPADIDIDLFQGDDLFLTNPVDFPQAADSYRDLVLCGMFLCEFQISFLTSSGTANSGYCPGFPRRFNGNPVFSASSVTARGGHGEKRMAFIISQITHNTNIFHRRGSCPFLRQTDPPAGSADPSDSMRFRPNDAAVPAGFFLFRKKIFRASPEKKNSVVFVCFF